MPRNRVDPEHSDILAVLRAVHTMMVQKPQQRRAHPRHGFARRKRLQIPNSNRQMLAVVKVRRRRHAALKPAYDLFNLQL
jgi:hypothetical protein